MEYHFLFNFLICYFLTSITTKAMEIGDAVYNLLWYEKHFPATEQSFVLMAIYRSQQAIQIKGLGWFSCSLETYLAVRSFYVFFTKLQNLLQIKWKKHFFAIPDDSKRYFLLYHISSAIGLELFLAHIAIMKNEELLNKQIIGSFSIAGNSFSSLRFHWFLIS